MAVILGAEGLPEHIRHQGADGQALDPLGAPVRRDGAGMAAPQLLRVALEEHGVEHFSEPVDVKVLQRPFFPLEHGPPQVAAACPDGGDQSHVDEGLGLSWTADNQRSGACSKCGIRDFASASPGPPGPGPGRFPPPRRLGPDACRRKTAHPGPASCPPTICRPEGPWRRTVGRRCPCGCRRGGPCGRYRPLPRSPPGPPHHIPRRCTAAHKPRSGRARADDLSFFHFRSPDLDTDLFISDRSRISGR